MTYRVIVTPAAESDLRTAYRNIRAQAPRARRATGSGALARPRKVWRATPSVVRWLPRARHLTNPSANCFLARATVGTIVFCLLFLRRRNRFTFCTFGTDPCVHSDLQRDIPMLLRR